MNRYSTCIHSLLDFSLLPAVEPLPPGLLLASEDEELNLYTVNCTNGGVSCRSFKAISLEALSRDISPILVILSPILSLPSIAAGDLGCILLIIIPSYDLKLNYNKLD